MSFNFTNVFFVLGMAVIARIPVTHLLTLSKLGLASKIEVIFRNSTPMNAFVQHKNALKQGTEYKITDQVYFDINIENEYLGRIILGLFGEVAPKTCKNFLEIVQHGINGKSYIGTKFHTAISRVMIQGGDIINNDGTGSISIYGDYFDDENFTIKHESAGLLAMANDGPNTNGCQFLITTMACPWLDGKNVIFGKVLKGAAVVHTIEHLKTDINENILKYVFISNSGVINTEPFYEESKNYEITLWSWIKAGWLPLTLSFATLGFFQFIMAQLNKYEITKL